MAYVAYYILRSIKIHIIRYHVHNNAVNVVTMFLLEHQETVVVVVS